MNLTKNAAAIAVVISAMEEPCCQATTIPKKLLIGNVEAHEARSGGNFHFIGNGKLEEKNHGRADKMKERLRKKKEKLHRAQVTADLKKAQEEQAAENIGN